MKKFYNITLLLFLLIFLSTYSPNEPDIALGTNGKFFEIKKIIVSNNLSIEKKQIYEKLNQIYNKNIFLIKREDIEEKLRNINFLEKIEVKKRYPDTIKIKIYETKPVGILYEDKKRYLIDSSSNLILIQDDQAVEGLPKIFGKGAASSLINFLKNLKENNFPVQKIDSLYYFQIDRWDLQLINNKIIKFPYNINNDIIKKTIELLNRDDFKKYNTIDLRVDGKIIVE